MDDGFALLISMKSPATSPDRVGYRSVPPHLFDDIDHAHPAYATSTVCCTYSFKLHCSVSSRKYALHRSPANIQE